MKAVLKTARPCAKGTMDLPMPNVEASSLTIIKVSSYAALLIFLGIAFDAAAFGQARQNTKTAFSPEEQELITARKANEEAQAEYYRELTNKLRQAPSPTKSFSESVAENPASVVGVIGTILGAIIVAIVGLTTLYVNNRNAIRAQMDTQFYEAMKRLGDTESQTLRASAAGLLALMAQPQSGEPAQGKSWFHLKRVRLSPYFETAVDQLLTGLRLENNRVAIESIRDALQRLVPHSPVIKTIQRLYEANLRMQEEVCSLIADFFVIRGCEHAPDPRDYRQQRELWEHVEYSSAGYSASDLRGLCLQNDSFRRRFENYLRIFQTQTTDDPGQLLSSNHKRLQVASARLRANVSLLATALERFRAQDAPQLSLKRLFFIDGNIPRDADLSGVDFSDSNISGILNGVNLERANFMGANLSVIMHGGSLRGSCLLGARLQGSWLTNVDMSDARLGYATISQWPNFERSNWWKANFYTTNPIPEVDSDLLRDVLEYHRKEVPVDLNEVHESVRRFLEGKLMETKFHPTIDAIKSCDLEGLRSLLNQGENLAMARSSTSHPTLLHYLTVEARDLPNKVEMARVLIDAGAEVNRPLVACACWNNVEIAAALLDAGAVINGTGGWSPLEEALYWSSDSVRDLLVDRGASVHNLRIAAGLGQVDLIEGFFNSDGSLKPQAGKIDWPFVEPDGLDLSSRVKTQLQAKIEGWSHDPQNIINNAFVYACVGNRIEVAKLLLQKGADINAIPPGFHDMGSGLHYAAKRGHRSMVEFLIEKGADVGLKDQDANDTPAGWAERAGQHSLKDYLEQVAKAQAQERHN